MANGAIQWLRRHKSGTPVRVTASAEQQNRVSNILNDIAGVGCTIIKPINNGGKGWKIQIDGSTDEEYPPGEEAPWGASGGNWDTIGDASSDVLASMDTDDTTKFDFGATAKRWKSMDMWFNDDWEVNAGDISSSEGGSIHVGTQGGLLTGVSILSAGQFWIQSSDKATITATDDVLISSQGTVKIESFSDMTLDFTGGLLYLVGISGNDSSGPAGSVYSDAGTLKIN